jgi:hypothetical protein
VLPKSMGSRTGDWGRHCGILGVVCLALSAGAVCGTAGAATGSLDAVAAIETSLDAPLIGAHPEASRPDKPARTMTGNPLWAVPLSSLLATRERPLFSPSRRPPPPAVAAVSADAAPPPPPKPAEPDHPLLTLVGTIVGDAESMGIFADQSDNKFISLKTGQEHAGWTLRAIAGREATFEKDSRRATLALPVRSATDRAGSPPLNAPGPTAAVSLKPGTWMDGDGRLISPPQSR